MPCLRILTNVPNSKIPEGFCNRIIPVLVKSVKKNPEDFTCVISGDCQLGFGGDASSPGAVATLESVGHISADENKVVLKELSDFIQNEIGVVPERFFISFYDMKGANVGRGNTIFDYL